MPNQEQYHDLENGDATREVEPNDAIDDRNLDEYSALVRYISTYRDPSKESPDNEEEESDLPRHVWYAPWRRWTKHKAAGGLFHVPDDWLTTDLQTGLTNAEVDKRRTKTGFNEITTETENLFLKFIGYFKGPILYGVPSLENILMLQSWNLPLFSPLVSGIGLILVLFVESSCSTLWSDGTKRNKQRMWLRH